uniref:Uncharacterized protein n=1 Tax=Trichobilharzia regenti TaxID=157069 RepID=A0AA85KHY9_TRIRE|nr:unnamed protein product [Trichobilharzia regenti]
MTNLTEGPLNIDVLKESYHNEFFRYIDVYASPKCIYWEKDLLAHVSSVVNNSDLKKHGVVNSFLLTSIKDTCSPSTCKSVIFIISPKVSIVDCVQSFVVRDSQVNQNTGKQYGIIAIPRFSFACKNFLKVKKLINKFTHISEFPLTIVPVDCDVLSMEDSSCFANYSIAEKHDSIYQFVQGLMRFQSIFGLFPKIFAKGEKAVQVTKMLRRMLDESKASEKSQSQCTALDEIESQTDLLILIDRSVDPLTPLLNQLTYAGLVDEKWGIRFGICKPCFSSENETSRKVMLNSTDMVYAEIRDQNFSKVGLTLSQLTKEISALVAESKSAKELSDLRRVVSQIPDIRLKRSELEIHTLLAEDIQKRVSTDDFLSGLKAQQDFLNCCESDKAHPFIEDCILRGAPLEEVLRLICIQSFCNGGLKQRLLEYYKNEIIQVYGFEHIFTLDNLERVGLLHESSSNLLTSLQTSNFTPQEKINLRHNNPANSKLPTSLKQTIINISMSYNSALKGNLRLIPSFPNHHLSDTEQALCNIFSGYIPISTRLIQILTNNWYPKSNLSSSVNPPPMMTGGNNPLSTTSGGGGVGSSNLFLSKATNAIMSGTRLLSGLRSQDSLEMSVLPEMDEQNMTFGFNHAGGRAGGGGEASSAGSKQRVSLPNYSTLSTLPVNRTPAVHSLSHVINAPELEELQLPVNNDLPFESSNIINNNNNNSSIGNSLLNTKTNLNKPRIIVVGFVGGVTHAEISTLRTLAAVEDCK